MKKLIILLILIMNIPTATSTVILSKDDLTLTILGVDNASTLTTNRSDYWDTYDKPEEFSTDVVYESALNFTTTCASGNRLYIESGNLACEAGGGNGTGTNYTADEIYINLVGTQFTQNETKLNETYLNNNGDTATGNYTFDTNTLHIDSSNDRVGVGTNTPSTKLHVNGTGNFTDSLYCEDTLTVVEESTFGNVSDYFKIYNNGSISLFGNANYVVQPNKYAFQASADSDSGLKFDNAQNRFEFINASGDEVLYISNSNGNAFINNRLSIGIQSAPYRLTLNGEFGATERSSDPDSPPEGAYVMWMSDGTGLGDDGDIMIAITAGGSTKSATLVDFSSLP